MTNFDPSQSSAAASLNEPIRPTCSTHPDREAVAENDYRTRALCRECYAEYIQLWRGLQ